MTHAPIINAIPTTYKGTTFRSRTEARWAVFFDELGVGWDYEPEGYELGEGKRYLPDFWLPDLESFFEVKPNLEDGLDTAFDLIESIFMATGAYYSAFVSDGPPRPYVDSRGYHHSPRFAFSGITESSSSWGRYSSGPEYVFYECPFCYRIDIGELNDWHCGASESGCKSGVGHSNDPYSGRARGSGPLPTVGSEEARVVGGARDAMAYRFWNPGGSR